MKQIFRIVVLALASLMTLQPLLAEAPCVPGNCAGDRCGIGCCAEMGSMPARVMGQACHSSRATDPMRSSTQGSHRCDMTATRVETQTVTPVKFRAMAGIQPAFLVQLQQIVASKASGEPHVSPLGPQRARYLLLQVFRI